MKFEFKCDICKKVFDSHSYVSPLRIIKLYSMAEALDLFFGHVCEDCQEKKWEQIKELFK